MSEDVDNKCVKCERPGVENYALGGWWVWACSEECVDAWFADPEGWAKAEKAFQDEMRESNPEWFL